MSASTRHVPVLKDEVLEFLRAKEGGDFLDCTFGGGGHSRAILEANERNTVTAMDRDARAVGRGEELKRAFPHRFEIFHARFSELDRIPPRSVFFGVLADLGVSTDQLFDGRGFSFRDKVRLDMRMDETQERSAWDIVNTLSEPDLRRTLFEGGLRQEARQLARAIVKSRPIDDTEALAGVIAQALPRYAAKKSLHPATLAFQAIRMSVNDERGEIERLMSQAPSRVRPGGRIAVITFHSIEDQLVARAMRGWERGADVPANWPGASKIGPRALGRMVSRRACRPTDAEILSNPAARSARLRVFEFFLQGGFDGRLS